MGAANAYKNAQADSAYLAAEIETMSRRDILVRLFQHAERMLVTAQMAMQNRQPELACTSVRKARDIFIELHATLNFADGGEIAGQLANLYLFIIQHLAAAGLRQDPTMVQAILPTVATLREAWEQIPAEHANTSSVPAGNQGHAVSIYT